MHTHTTTHSYLHNCVHACTHTHTMSSFGGKWKKQQHQVDWAGWGSRAEQCDISWLLKVQYNGFLITGCARLPEMAVFVKGRASMSVISLMQFVVDKNLQMWFFVLLWLKKKGEVVCPVGVSVYVHVSHLTTSLLLWQFISLFMPAYCHLPHDVCHHKPWFQYQALCEGSMVR